jgi:hypothetical protein
MEAYTRISLPVNKLNVSSPEGDDKYETPHGIKVEMLLLLP